MEIHKILPLKKKQFTKIKLLMQIKFHYTGTSFRLKTGRCDNYMTLKSQAGRDQPILRKQTISKQACGEPKGFKLQELDKEI